MSFKDVKELRKNGDLEKALDMANIDLETNKEEIWNKRSLAWVYYDYLKKFALEKNYMEFCKYLDLLSELKLPPEEHMIFDQAAWQTGKIVNSLTTEDILPEDKEAVKLENGNYSVAGLHNLIIGYACNILNKIRDYHFSKPSEAYTFILKIYLKRFQVTEKPIFLDLADWWNFENFMPADYEKRVAEDGKSYISLAEQVYIKYSKELLRNFIGAEVLYLDKNKITDFIPRLDKMIAEHPDWLYAVYYKAKLFFELDRKREVRDFILPFAIKKQNEFWVWDLLSETFQDNEPVKIACLCKAASCDAEEKMKVNVHKKLADLLRRSGQIAEAEVEEALFRSAKGDITGSILNAKSDIKENTEKSNAFYQKHLSEAEDVLFSNIPSEIALVEFVNKDKKILNFVISRSKAGFFKYDRFLQKAEIGDWFKIRLDGSGINAIYKVLTIEKTDKPASSDILKEFKGRFRKNENQPFGFAEDIFFEPGLVEKHKLENGVEVAGTAIISFNKKKNDWGWKAIKIE